MLGTPPVTARSRSSASGSSTCAMRSAWPRSSRIDRAIDRPTSSEISRATSSTATTPPTTSRVVRSWPPLASSACRTASSSTPRLDLPQQLLALLAGRPPLLRRAAPRAPRRRWAGSAPPAGWRTKSSGSPTSRRTGGSGRSVAATRNAPSAVSCWARRSVRSTWSSGAVPAGAGSGVELGPDPRGQLLDPGQLDVAQHRVGQLRPVLTRRRLGEQIEQRVDGPVVVAQDGVVAEHRRRHRRPDVDHLVVRLQRPRSRRPARTRRRRPAARPPGAGPRRPGRWRTATAAGRRPRRPGRRRPRRSSPSSPAERSRSCWSWCTTAVICRPMPTCRAKSFSAVVRPTSALVCTPASTRNATDGITRTVASLVLIRQSRSRNGERRRCGTTRTSNRRRRWFDTAPVAGSGPAATLPPRSAASTATRGAQSIQPGSVALSTARAGRQFRKDTAGGTVLSWSAGSARPSGRCRRVRPRHRNGPAPPAPPRWHRSPGCAGATPVAARARRRTPAATTPRRPPRRRRAPPRPGRRRGLQHREVVGDQPAQPRHQPGQDVHAGGAETEPAQLTRAGRGQPRAAGRRRNGVRPDRPPPGGTRRQRRVQLVAPRAAAAPGRPRRTGCRRCRVRRPGHHVLVVHPVAPEPVGQRRQRLAGRDPLDQPYRGGGADRHRGPAAGRRSRSRRSRPPPSPTGAAQRASASCGQRRACSGRSRPCQSSAASRGSSRGRDPGQRAAPPRPSPGCAGPAGRCRRPARPTSAPSSSSCAEHVLGQAGEPGRPACRTASRSQGRRTDQ